MTTTQTLVGRAADFALHHHRRIGHVRKYTGEPYFSHLAEVAYLLKLHGQSDEVIAAGYLHDIIEDTPVTKYDLQYHFGLRIPEIVLMVTDVSRPEDGNRAARKAKDRAHLAQADKDGRAVKYADLISNLTDISKHDPSFARVFVKEARDLLLNAIGPDSDSSLFRAAWATLHMADDRLFYAARPQEVRHAQR